MGKGQITVAECSSSEIFNDLCMELFIQGLYQNNQFFFTDTKWVDIWKYYTLKDATVTIYIFSCSFSRLTKLGQ